MDVQAAPRQHFDLLRADPLHPSLQFKRVGGYWSARVGRSYRALALSDGTDFIWVWIGPHDAYERLIRQATPSFTPSLRKDAPTHGNGVTAATIRPMTLADHPAVFALAAATPGTVVRATDAADGFDRYLARNPGLSFVADEDGQIVGCPMAGHDGRRGYLQYLVIASAWRGRGIGRRLVEHCLVALAAEGIVKSHLDVLVENADGAAFWERLGWQRRADIHRYSFILGDDPNA